MSTPAGITRAQANFVRDLLCGRGRGYVWVDGPIADTGCIRVRHRMGAGAGVSYRGVHYLNRDGREVRWDSSADRPARDAS